jgi:squalene cyclase
LCLFILSFSAFLLLGGIEEDRLLSIESAINQGVAYLVGNQNEDGSVSLDNDETFKVWETANVLLAVHIADRTKTNFCRKATEFLLDCQRQDGSFYSARSFEKGHHCVETTSVSLLALAAANKDISRGVRFLLDKQMPDGSWEIGIPQIREDRFFPSVTGYALGTLMCLRIFNEQIQKGMDYILRTQKEDGSWGQSGLYYDTPFYATHLNLLALRLFGLEKSRSCQRAVAFIEKDQNGDGSWGRQRKDRPSPALKTSLALNSLLTSLDRSDCASIERGIHWLLRSQKTDGHWDGGNFVDFPGKKEDIFSTAMAVLALKRYEYYKKGMLLLCPDG